MFVTEAMKRMAAGAGGGGPPAVLKLEQKYELTHDQLHHARPLLEAHVASVRHSGHHRGLPAFPAYWLHKPKETVRGTALLFHGFAATNEQVKTLGQYLFENGFNVYAPALSGHEFNDPDKYWPKIEAKEDFKQRALEAVNQDPELKEYFAKREPPYDYRKLRDTVQKLRRLTPFMRDLEHAAKHGKADPNFYNLFEEQPPTQVGYLEHAQARLAEVRALPGPVIAFGVDLGATVALALASAEPVGTIAKVVGINPLLQIKTDFVRDLVALAGPLGLHESSQYDESEYYSLGCDVTSSLLGASIQSNAAVEKLARVATLFVYVDKGSVSDQRLAEQFVTKLSRQDRSVAHAEASLDEKNVRAPALDTSTNPQWANLCQQIFNFAAEGQFDATELTKAGQSDSFPKVVERVEGKPKGVGGALLKAFGNLGKFGQPQQQHKEEESSVYPPQASGGGQSTPPGSGLQTQGWGQAPPSWQGEHTSPAGRVSQLPKSYVSGGGDTSSYAPSAPPASYAVQATYIPPPGQSYPPSSSHGESSLPYRVVTDTPTASSESPLPYKVVTDAPSYTQQSFQAPPVQASLPNKLETPHSYYAPPPPKEETPHSYYATPQPRQQGGATQGSGGVSYPSVASPYGVRVSDDQQGRGQQQGGEGKEGPKGLGGHVLNAFGNLAKNMEKIAKPEKRDPAYGY